MIGFFRGRETTSDAWVIGRWYEFPAEEAQAGFHDRVSTAAWLRTVEPEDLRRIAHQYIDGTLRSGLSDHDLVEQLVGLIVSGALRVWRITTPIRPRVSHEIAALRSETTLQTSSEPAVTPSQLGSVRAPAPVPPVTETSTFPGDVDVAAQAATLTAAAANGVPFCPT